MKLSGQLPEIELSCGAEWEKLSDRYILNKKILCGQFEIEFLLLKSSANISLDRKQALTLLEGKLKLDANKKSIVPWVNPSVVGQSKVETLQDSLITVLTDKLRLSGNKDLLDFSELILPDKIEAFPLRWSEFPFLPGLFCTQPDVAVGNWHIKLWRVLPNMNCGIHRHSREPWLKETHFLLAGSGWMVKYHKDNAGTEFERLPVEFGQAHKIFFTEKSNGLVSYPWHAWQAGPAGSLFMALEDWSLRKT